MEVDTHFEDVPQFSREELSSLTYIHCLQGKKKRQSIRLSTFKELRTLEHISADIDGKLIPTDGGFLYFFAILGFFAANSDV